LLDELTTLPRELTANPGGILWCNYRSTQTIGRTLVNLHTARNDGHPNNTPLNGSPGGGSGGIAMIIDTERIPASSVELQALNTTPDIASGALTWLTNEAARMATTASNVVETATGQRPIPPPADPYLHIIHSYRCALVLTHTNHLTTDRPLWRTWSTIARDIEHITTNWGYTPAPPRKPTRQDTPDGLAIDLTDTWCRSCLNAGHRSPRHRGDLCRWCYDFVTGQGFAPPADLIDQHHTGHRLTMRQVDGARMAWKAEQKRRERKRR